MLAHSAHLPDEHDGARQRNGIDAPTMQRAVHQRDMVIGSFKASRDKVLQCVALKDVKA